MKYFLIVFTVLVLGFDAKVLTDKEQWLNFKKTFKKNYKFRSSENERFRIFQNNLKLIEEHNAKASQGASTYWLGVTQFADLTPQEFIDKFGSSIKPLPEERFVTEKISLRADADSPTTAEIDWREKGVVTPVKNQGDCGSCWAFSATAAIESAYKIKTGKTVSLSEQNLIDCDKSSHGCIGGSMNSAFKWMVGNKGLQLNHDYPYEAVENKCRFNRTKPLVPISTYKAIGSKNEAAIENAVLKQPVSVAIYAGRAMQLYKSGVLYDPSCCKSLKCANHAITLVGLGVTSDNTTYYIAKNSWGPMWGEQGFLKIHRGSDQCGLSNMASYPIIR